MWAKGKKHAATKEQTSQVSPPETGKAFSGQMASSNPLKRLGKRSVLVVALVILLVVSAVSIVLFLNRSPDLPYIDGEKSITQQVEDLSEEQADLFVKAKINPKKDTNRAYARALILDSRKQYADAERQFKQIDDAGVASQDILYDYMYVAVRNDNPDTALKIGDKIIGLIQGKSDIPQEERDLETRRLRAKLTDFKADN